MQILQRRAHAPRAIDCKRLSFVFRHVEKHKYGLKTIKLKHRFELVGFTDAAIKAQPEEFIGFVLRGSVATLKEDLVNSYQPHNTSGLAN